MGIIEKIKKFFGIIEIIRLKRHKNRHAEGMPHVTMGDDLHLIFGDKGIGMSHQMDVLEAVGPPESGRSWFFRRPPYKKLKGEETNDNKNNHN